MLLDLGHKLTFFGTEEVEPRGGTKRWNVETCLLTTFKDRPWPKVSSLGNCFCGVITSQFD